MEMNAVFEGGGVKGISLAGAVEAAEQSGIRFRHVAGTSSGSIIAAFIAAGYSAKDLRQLILETPFGSLLHRAPIFQMKWVGPIGPAVRLLLKKGLYSGDRLEQWIHACLLKKNIRTFGDLKNNQLRIIASDISNGRLLVLPEDIEQYGIDPSQLLISQAVRMSSSLPYFFDPVIIRNARSTASGRSAQMAYIVDGGVLSNFPLWLFDEDRDARTSRIVPTVGFQMVGGKTPQPHRILGLLTMQHAMFETMLSAHDQRYIDKQNRFRTIKIPTSGIGTTQFNLTTKESMTLYQSGLDAGLAFFDKWDYVKYEQLYQTFVRK